MTGVNKTLFIPLCGKARVSRQGVILHDPDAERIWEAEGFPPRGKSKSKWLAYNMAMRARVFDDWTEAMLAREPEALALHIGCGLDSRFERVKAPRALWLDCDLPEVIDVRRRCFAESARYQMRALDASDPGQIAALPESEAAVVVLEGLSMYLTNGQLRGMFAALAEKYRRLNILMDVYTEFGARASKLKNPIQDVGVTEVYGLDDIEGLVEGLPIRFLAEHSFTPPALVEELPPLDRAVFRLLFTGRTYGKIYRLLEFTSEAKEHRGLLGGTLLDPSARFDCSG